MSIRTASIPVGATFAPTGGTATSLVLLNSDAKETKAFIGTTGVTPLTRSELTFVGKPPKVSSSAPGGFTQGRASVKITVPKVLANLARTLNSAEFSIAIDPETTAAEVDAIKSAMINLIIDADFSQLWLNQSTD